MNRQEGRDGQGRQEELMDEQESFAYEREDESLVHFVPELRDAYQRELEWWGAERPGPDVIYDEILNP